MPSNATPDNSINKSIADYIETMSQDTEGVLRSIDLTLKAIARQDGLLISQASLQNLAQAEKQAIAADRRAASRGTSQQQQTTEDRRNAYRRASDDYIPFDRQKGKARAGKMFDKLTDDFEDAFTEALFGTKHPLQDAFNESIRQFAKSLDTTVDGLGKEIGKRAASKLGDISYTNLSGQKTTLGEQLRAERETMAKAASNVLNSGLNAVSRGLGGSGGIDVSGIFEEDRSQEEPQVRDIDDIVTRNVQDVNTSVQDGFNELVQAILNMRAAQGEEETNLGEIVEGNLTSEIDLGEIVEGLPDIPGIKDIGEMGEAAEKILPAVQNVVPELGKFAPAVGKAVGAATKMLPALGPVTAVFPELHVAMLAATLAIDALSEAIGPAIEGFKSFASGVSGAANRTLTENAKLLELRKERVKADSDAVVKAAYQVIEDSANKVTQVWDNVLTTVSATQGYNKAAVQDLWSSYAQRLSRDQLSSVVSSADIMENLKSVLSKGLSGKVAEEFAYQATLLSSAVPTQDFFQYAETYASVAANAIQAGRSQEEAINIANEELNSFASNLLYASRQIAGGFTTSLTNGADLFEKSAKIAMTSRSGDLSDISAVLTSVSAIVGSIAPDLSSSLVDAVVSAATGGNSSELTAIRSLAGVGASNTAFLQALANDPQGVFVELFRNLAGFQNMSSENYMEVAEALQSTFGLSMDAFARVDFNYLADAIEQMRPDNSALEENMALLAAGQTTSTESQLRMQKINEYMIDEGLAYVLDNEVARSIQQHMWDEQLAQQITEAEFAVNLQGSALDLLQGIVTTVQKISDFINPAAWLGKVANVALTAIEGATQRADVKKILEEGKVGKGTAAELYNLTTAGTRLNLTKDYLTMMGGTSGTAIVKNLIQANQLYTSTAAAMPSILSSISGAIGAGKSALKSALDATNKAQSYYTTSVISKSVASTLSSGDWRDAFGYNASWVNYEESRTEEYEQGARTQDDAAKLSEKLNTSISEYVTKMTANANSLDNVRKEVTKLSNTSIPQAVDEATGQILHRGFYTSQEIAEQVAAGVTEETTGSFDEWLKEFEAANDNMNLSAELDNYGASLEEIKRLYEETESTKSAATSKARQLHEVQFWEDMQHFATVDFPWYMREWERYYIQHEAYTQATGNAYEDAIKLNVEEKGELGDSVIALAKALTENNMWQEELGDKIKDPVVQTNALLSKILLTVEAIMQQNNETSVVSVPTSLASLGLGFTNS